MTRVVYYEGTCSICGAAKSGPTRKVAASRKTCSRKWCVWQQRARSLSATARRKREEGATRKQVEKHDDPWAAQWQRLVGELVGQGMTRDLAQIAASKRLLGA